MSIPAYPLQWPDGKPRTPLYLIKRSQFRITSIDKATKALQHEIKLLGGEGLIVSTNMRVRLDGMPYSKDRPPADKGVAVYFNYEGQQMSFACDQWETMQENIYAIAKTIEALRGIERWGSGDMMRQAFTGFLQLPAPEDPFAILGLKPGAPAAVIESTFRALAKSHHPDAGGDIGQWNRLQAAKNRALELSK